MSKGKKNVLFIDQGVAFGGSVVVVATIARYLDTDKYISLLAAEMDYSILQHHIKDTAKIYLIKHPINYSHWAAFNEKLEGLHNKLIKKTLIYLFSLIRSITDAYYVMRLCMVIIRNKVDILHINNTIDALIAAKLTRRKCVWHIHGIWVKGALRTFEKILLKKADAYIAISQAAKSGALAVGLPDHKIKTVHNPVIPVTVSEQQLISLRQQYNIHKNEKTIGIFGRLVRWKGHIEFLQAVKQVSIKVPELKVFIIGDESEFGAHYTNELKALVAELGITDIVVFTGYLQDVEKYYALMDLVVHASIEPEPFGLVITEAMAQAVPVVASSLGAPSEIIEDGHDGYLADPADTLVFADKITRLLQDTQLREQMGQRAKQKTLDHYSPSAYARAIENIYEEILR